MTRRLRPTPDSVWPSSEVAHEVAERLHHAGDYDGAAVAAAYAHLLAHPVGTEAVIRTLRALRRLDLEARITAVIRKLAPRDTGGDQ